LKITFNPEAIEKARIQAEEAGLIIEKFCGLVLKDYPYGLKLIQQQSGEDEFIITEKAIESPAEILSGWVKKAYHGDTGKDGEKKIKKD
ncbi:MAG: hypothetical protein U9N73_12020, partial [Candidatus Auribacterota bacterium]|nr:hypothetical protein [Candidatus Auribacterota bacterium]